MRANQLPGTKPAFVCASAQTKSSDWPNIPSKRQFGTEANAMAAATQSGGSNRATVSKIAGFANGHAGSALADVLPLNSPLRAIVGIERAVRSRNCYRSTVLFSEGRAAQGVYVLCTGSAKVSICSAEGKKLIMRIARPGDVLGLYAGLTGRPFEATAEMVEPGRVGFVSRQDLLTLISKQESFGLGLVQLFSEQFREFVDHTRMLQLSESATEKLARLILKWSRDFGELTTGGIRLQILLTHEEIAQLIGASRETVTRLFSVLKRDRIIGLRGGLMVIRDSAALASMAQLSP